MSIRGLVNERRGKLTRQKVSPDVCIIRRVVADVSRLSPDSGSL